MRIASITAIAVLIMITGCGSTVSVAVLDGDTNEPISGAGVSVDYFHDSDLLSYTFLDGLRPRQDNAITGTNGVARIRIRGELPQWNISASGYHEYHETGSSVPKTFQQRLIDGKQVYAVPLYRPPPPEIWMVIPDGYRGPLRITRRADFFRLSFRFEESRGWLVTSE